MLRRRRIGYLFHLTLMHFNIASPKRRTLLLVLLTAIHWRVYRDHWIATSSEPAYSNQRAGHIFLYRSFLYPRGSNAFDDGIVTPTIRLTTLFAADTLFNATAYCSYWKGTKHGLFFPSSPLPLLYKAPPLKQALVARIIGLEHCKLRVYAATCTFPVAASEESMDINVEEKEDGRQQQQQQGRFMLEFSDRQWGEGVRGLNDLFSYYVHRRLVKSPTAIELPWKVADTTPRQLVLCVSRMLAFENWRMVVTALEVYRRLGVDLVVTHVLSVVSPLFALMRHYEFTTGLLRMEPAVVLPKVRLSPSSGGAYDPNAETEHTNQLTAAHECFYEYKASAAFISLIDWDDLLVVGGGDEQGDFPPPPNSLPQALRMAFGRFPNAAYFRVNRLPANLLSLPEGETYDYNTTLKAIDHPPVFNSKKLVVVPSRLFGFWLHNADNFVQPGRHNGEQLPIGYALMLHLGGMAAAQSNPIPRQNYELKRTRGKKGGVSTADDEGKSHAWEEYFRLVDSFQNYNPVYTGRTGRCAEQIMQYYYSSMDAGKRRCLGYHLCGIPPISGVKCVNARNHFRAYHPTGAAQVVAHVRQAASLEESTQGCIV